MHSLIFLYITFEKKVSDIITSLCVFLQEVNVMASLDHPNIVGLLGFCRIPPCIMTDLCSGGNLAQKLAKFQSNQTKIPWNERLQIVRVILHIFLYKMKQWCYDFRPMVDGHAVSCPAIDQ